jgi:hypothetical protein
MRGMGDFANRIEDNDAYLARVTDSVPQRGEVTEDHHDWFSRLFVKTFRNSHRIRDVANASWLLAMRRPDVFLCISDQDRTQAANRMGSAKSTLNLETNWDGAIEVIQAPNWYNVEKSEDRRRRLWERRTAKSNAIHYRP